jgi:endonuclease III
MTEHSKALRLTVHRVFDEANCSYHPLTIEASVLDGAETLIAFGRCCCTSWNPTYTTCEGYCDSESFAIARLATGKFLLVEESADNSGHG